MTTGFSIEATIILNKALALFKAGHYFECHELLETQLWLNETDTTQKRFYQGLIHLAVAQHHCQQGNPGGHQKQQQKALQKTTQLTPPQHQWLQRFIVEQPQL